MRIVTDGRVTFSDVKPYQFVEGEFEVGVKNVIKGKFRANWGPHF